LQRGGAAMVVERCSNLARIVLVQIWFALAVAAVVVARCSSWFRMMKMVALTVLLLFRNSRW